MELQLAQKAVLYSTGSVLLIQKSAADPYNPLKWEIPGGRLQVGEELSDHLKREVREEVGLEIEIGPPLAMWQWTMGSGAAAKTVVAVSRLCYPLTSEVSFAGNEDTDYISAWKWVTVSEVASLDLIPTARDAILESLKVLQNYVSPR
jgi:8-oxo-dGTP pyrophosphatase MutT (NUDIX family)